MLTRTLVATLVLVGVVALSVQAKTYTQDFDSVGDGTDLLTLPGWVGNPDSAAPPLRIVSNAQSVSAPNSALTGGGDPEWIGPDLSDSAVLGFIPTTDHVVISFNFYYDTGSRIQIGTVGTTDGGVGDPSVGKFEPNMNPNEIVLGGNGWTSAGLSNLPPGSWHDITMDFNMDDRTFTVDFNGTTSSAQPFIGTHTDIRYFAILPIHDGNFYVDNLSITGVPEPATLGLLGIGGLFAVLRRRR